MCSLDEYQTLHLHWHYSRLFTLLFSRYNVQFNGMSRRKEQKSRHESHCPLGAGVSWDAGIHLGGSLGLRPASSSALSLSLSLSVTERPDHIVHPTREDRKQHPLLESNSISLRGSPKDLILAQIDMSV